MLIVGNKFESLLRIANLNIVNESAFTNSDYNKHDYKYVTSVIQSLLDGNEVKLGSQGTSGAVSLRDLPVKSIASFKKSLSKFAQNISQSTVEDFNELMKPLNVTWKQIFKGDFSGYSGGNSKISTADQENITCDLFEHMLNGNMSVPSNDVIQDIAQKYVGDKGLSQDWLTSFMYQCAQLHDTTNIPSLNKLKKKSGITVCRTPDLKKNGLGDVMKAQAILANENGVSTAAIDSSDIYCVADSSAVSSALSKAMSESDPSKKSANILNAFSKLFNNGTLVGISLKKVTQPGHTITQPRNKAELIPTVESISYAERKSKGISLTWKCEMNVPNEGADTVVFNLRDNGQGALRFELVSSSGQRIGDVPAGLWKNPNREESFYSLLNIDTSIPLTLDVLRDACAKVKDWNQRKFLDAFNTYYNYAAKISNISLDHLLSM